MNPCVCLSLCRYAVEALMSALDAASEGTLLAARVTVDLEGMVSGLNLEVGAVHADSLTLA